MYVITQTASMTTIYSDVVRRREHVVGNVLDDHSLRTLLTVLGLVHVCTVQRLYLLQLYLWSAGQSRSEPE